MTEAGRPNKYPFRDMEVGDSFECDSKKDFARAQSAAHTFSRSHKQYKFITNHGEMSVTRIQLEEE